MQRRSSKTRAAPRMPNHKHPVPWSMSIAPGKRENPHRSNTFHRCWLADCGKDGRPLAPNKDKTPSEPRRWNKERKTEYYQNCLQDLMSRKSHDELYAKSAPSTLRLWTHLNQQGTQPLGFNEKLNTIPKRSTGLHLKHGLYSGRFENVQPSQVMLKSGRRNERRELEEWVVDSRPRFDNRLKDDMIRVNDATTRELATMSYDLYRPVHTRSCPQMGVDFMHR